MICASWPHCEADAVGGKFCEFHQTALDRVKASYKGRKWNGPVGRLPASVKVSHVAPVAKLEPPPKPKRAYVKRAPKPPKPSREERKAERLKARADADRRVALSLVAFVIERGGAHLADVIEALGLPRGKVKRAAKVAVGEHWLTSSTIWGYRAGAVAAPAPA